MRATFRLRLRGPWAGAFHPSNCNHRSTRARWGEYTLSRRHISSSVPRCAPVSAKATVFFAWKSPTQSASESPNAANPATAAVQRTDASNLLQLIGCILRRKGDKSVKKILMSRYFSEGLRAMPLYSVTMKFPVRQFSQCVGFWRQKESRCARRLRSRLSKICADFSPLHVCLSGGDSLAQDRRKKFVVRIERGPKFQQSIVALGARDHGVPCEEVRITIVRTKHRIHAFKRKVSARTNGVCGDLRISDGEMQRCLDPRWCASCARNDAHPTV